MASPRAGTLALDSMEDAAYLRRLRCVVCSGAEAQSSGLDPVAPVIDLKTLLRLHNLVEGHTTPEERGSKRAALAYFVMDVTQPQPRTLTLDVGFVEAVGNDGAPMALRWRSAGDDGAPMALGKAGASARARTWRSNGTLVLSIPHPLYARSTWPPAPTVCSF